MAVTPVYSWPLPNLANAADGPDGFSDLGLAIESTIVTNKTRIFYNGHRAGVTWVSSPGRTTPGPWASANGFIATGDGLMVPSAGVYMALFQAYAPGFVFTGRTFVDLDCTGMTPGIPAARAAIPGGTAETVATVTLLTPALTTGSVIAPYWFQSSGGGYSGCVVDLRITRLFGD